MKRKVLITGGNGDIAKAVANQLVATGLYDVFAPGRKEMDVTDVGSVRVTLEKYRPNILVNNAGYVVPQSIRVADLEVIKRHIDVNLTAVFNCTAIGLQMNPSLDIVNIGSSAATKVHATWSEYCATKAAVVMATKCWAADGLFAVCVSPGRTCTKMRKGLFPDEDQSTLLDPNDFAKVVVKAIMKGYPSGSHINVTKQNVRDLIDEAH